MYRMCTQIVYVYVYFFKDCSENCLFKNLYLFKINAYKMIKKIINFLGSPTTSSIECSFNLNYIRQKLEHGLLRIWQDVQQKVKGYLLASDISPFKFDEFIHILALIQR